MVFVSKDSSLPFAKYCTAHVTFVLKQLNIWPNKWLTHLLQQTLSEV